MKYFEFYIINNFGELLFYEDLTRSGLKTTDNTFRDKIKNVFGMAHALKSLVRELSPIPIFSFRNFSTNQFKFNLYEKQTGLKLILITQTTSQDMSSLLERIYKECYQEFCTRNMLYEMD